MLPEGLDETLHLLGLSLHPDVGLKLPQRLVQFHAREVHLIHHAAVEALQKSDGGEKRNVKLENAAALCFL